MSRNLKALGLALVAALALGAIGAQGASAVVEHSLNSDVNSTVLTGNNTGEGNHVFRVQTGGATVTCSVATFSGTNVDKVRDTVTVHPKYDSCTFAGAEVEITTDGCNYILDSDTTSGGHFSGEHAAVSVECESTHDIVIDAACEITFTGAPNNQSLHGVRYTEVTHNSKKSITVNGTVGNIHYSTIGGFACTLIGKPEGTYTTGIYEGKVSVTGYEDGSQSPGTTTTGTTWNHGGQVNIFLSTPT